MMEEQSASNEELHEFPEEIFSETGSRFRFKFCQSSFRCVKRLMSSGLLLKGFALAFGLWNPHRRWRALFALVFLLVDVYLLFQLVIFLFLCPTGSTRLDSWFCVNNDSINIASTSVEHKGIFFLFHIRKLVINNVGVNISRLISHLTFFWSVWKLSKENSCLRQENTLTLVSHTRWVKLNCVFLFFICARISCEVGLVVENSSSNPTYYLIERITSSVSCWTSLLTIWSFGTLTSSLETLATRCKHDIMTSEHLEDAIKHHQKFCKIIFGTSNVFKLWFIVHWISYTITCVLWAANLVGFFDLITKSWSICYYLIISVGIYFYSFIYPCYQAAALTGKCQQMLADFNLMTEEDWHNNHPFRKRSQLHLFLQYASYANCGYRVWGYTFSSMSVFFSTLFAVVGIGTKFL